MNHSIATDRLETEPAGRHEFESDRQGVCRYLLRDGRVFQPRTLFVFSMLRPVRRGRDSGRGRSPFQPGRALQNTARVPVRIFHSPGGLFRLLRHPAYSIACRGPLCRPLRLQVCPGGLRIYHEVRYERSGPSGF